MYLKHFFHCVLILLTCVFFSISHHCTAQRNDTEAAFYNIGIGSVFGAVGAAINKKPDEKLGRVLLKGLGQGALGGYVTFESKRMLRWAQENENWKWVWTAKFVNAAGTSIKENAAMNRDFWNHWAIHFGFNRIELEKTDKFRVHYRVMPIEFLYTTRAFFVYSFDARKSLTFGDFIFHTPTLKNANAGTSAGYIVYDYGDYTQPDVTNRDIYRIAVHELIHRYQANDALGFNSFYNRPISKWCQKSAVGRFVNKYLYLDLHYIPLRILYIQQYLSNQGKYYGNHFEHEAGYYSGTF